MRNFTIWLLEPLFRRLTAYMGACGMILYDSGGSEPTTPDYAPLAAAAANASALSAQLGQDQLAEARRQYDNNVAVSAPIVASQTALAQSQADQSTSLFKDYTDTYKPVAQSVVADAMNFNTASAKERFATSAASDLQSQQANQEAQTARSMAAMGVNPNSGKFAALKSSSAIANAAARAGATSNARVQADDLSVSKRIAAYGLGANLPAAATSAANSSVNAGSAAVANNAQAGNSLVSATASASDTALKGVSSSIQGLGSILNSQTSTYDSDNAAKASSQSGYLSLVGAGIGAASKMYSTKSTTGS